MFFAKIKSYVTCQKCLRRNSCFQTGLTRILTNLFVDAPEKTSGSGIKEPPFNFKGRDGEQPSQT